MATSKKQSAPTKIQRVVATQPKEKSNAKSLKPAAKSNKAMPAKVKQKSAVKKPIKPIKKGIVPLTKLGAKVTNAPSKQAKSQKNSDLSAKELQVKPLPKKAKIVAVVNAPFPTKKERKGNSVPMSIAKESTPEYSSATTKSSQMPPLKSNRSLPEPNKTRPTRNKGLESSPAPIVLASNAAKASFGNFISPTMPLHPTPSHIKKDPKLSDNWKRKTAAQMSDAEIIAMPDSQYMNALQLQFFRAKLVQLKYNILDSANETTEHLRDDSSVVPDPTDRATIEEEHALELRTRDRERKLLKKIEQSITRIDAGDYGYCDETGEPIGTGRLLARPTATLSLEAQQRRELKQKLFGD